MPLKKKKSSEHNTFFSKAQRKKIENEKGNYVKIFYKNKCISINL